MMILITNAKCFINAVKMSKITSYGSSDVFR
jgi:hypothetical protein